MTICIDMHVEKSCYVHHTHTKTHTHTHYNTDKPHTHTVRIPHLVVNELGAEEVTKDMGSSLCRACGDGTKTQ